MGSVVQEWIAEGEARGIKKGIEKGIEKGEAKLLLRLLEHRFGALPGNVKTRIASASADELELWGERVLDAPGLAAIFAPSGKASH